MSCTYPFCACSLNTAAATCACIGHPHATRPAETTPRAVSTTIAEDKKPSPGGYARGLDDDKVTVTGGAQTGGAARKQDDEMFPEPDSGRIGQAFKAFLTSLSVDKSQLKHMYELRDNALACLKKRFGKEMTWEFAGSYGRDTCDRPLKDIDVYLIFDAKCAIWKNPATIRATITEILRLGQFDAVPQKRAISVYAGKYTVDLVPVRPDPSGGYEIFNPQVNDFEPTNSNAIKAAMDELDDILDNGAAIGRQIVRGVKNWNRRINVWAATGRTILKSVHLEVLTIKALRLKFEEVAAQAGRSETPARGPRVWFASALRFIAEHFADPAIEIPGGRTSSASSYLFQVTEKGATVARNAARLEQLQNKMARVVSILNGVVDLKQDHLNILFNRDKFDLVPVKPELVHVDTSSIRMPTPGSRTGGTTGIAAGYLSAIHGGGGGYSDQKGGHTAASGAAGRAMWSKFTFDPKTHRRISADEPDSHVVSWDALIDGKCFACKKTAKLHACTCFSVAYCSSCFHDMRKSNARRCD